MNTLEQAAITNRIQIGDILLFRNGERGWLNFSIRKLQERMLLDLNPDLKNSPVYQKLVKEASVYTHSAQVIGMLTFGEQYAPHARMRFFSDIPAGTQVMVQRLPLSDPGNLVPVIDHWRDVIARKDKYPARELVYYWLKWGSKLAFSRKFANVFRDRKNNVCSGEVVHASQQGGNWFVGEKPEAWYPARLAIDGKRLHSIGVFTV